MREEQEEGEGDGGWGGVKQPGGSPSLLSPNTTSSAGEEVKAV